MRTLGFGGLAAVLAAGLAVTVATAADDDDDAPKKPPALKFGYTGRYGKTPHGEIGNAEPVKDAKPRPPSAAAQAAARREREFSAYLRRMDACDRIMEIAIATNNEPMQHRAEQLGQRIWAVYQQNSDTPVPHSATDDVTLDKQSGSVLPPAGSPRPGNAGRQVP